MIHITLDFETYSEAGYYLTAEGVWRGSGLAAVGSAVYGEHPSTRALCLTWNPHDGQGIRLWIEGMPPPQELFDLIDQGALLNAWNVAFERDIWSGLGWPPVSDTQWRCAMARSYAHSLPGKLEKAAVVLEVAEQKDNRGKLLITKLSKPPGSKDPVLLGQLYAYCMQDIRAEDAVSKHLPELSAQELIVWQVDQRINRRGTYIDKHALDACIIEVERVSRQLNAELRQITNEQVASADAVQQLNAWLSTQGVNTPSLDAAHLAGLLADPTIPSHCRRALEIRSTLNSKSTAKVYSIRNRICSDGRVRGLFAYCGADRTGRWAGRGPQPQNLPASGPPTQRCQCGSIHGAHRPTCPDCGELHGPTDGIEWDVEAALADIMWSRVKERWGDPMATVAGCLRGLFVAAPGKQFICSDYSAIEAVILAFWAGEQWRMDAFNTHGKIYEMSASMISGVPFETIGKQHPLRRIGKIAELASGYGGGVNAWKRVGADSYMSEQEIQRNVYRWRDANPAITGLWKEVETAACAAVLSPGNIAHMRGGVSYQVRDDILFCRLPSGRSLTYHSPRVEDGALSYMGWTSGGWYRIHTWGGKLVENIDQAMARDILAHALVNLETSRYPIVMHIHDEIVSEIPSGEGSLEEFETIMSMLPAWCSNWPIKAKGGWVGHRYRKG